MGCSLIVPGEDDFEYCEGEPPCTDAGQMDGGSMDAQVDAGSLDGGGDGSADDDAGPNDAAASGDAGDPVAPPRHSLVATGAEHTCLIRGGSVYCTGSGLGNGHPSGALLTRMTAVSGPLPSDIVSVGAAGRLTCALSASGQLFCWGENTEGEVGDGTQVDRPTPARAVPSVSDFDMVAVAERSVCARRAGGGVLCWGDGTEGQLGNGAFTSSVMPVTANASDVVQLDGGFRHFCSVGSDGSVSCWGANDQGQLGSTTFGLRSAQPRVVPGVANALDVSAGAQHTCSVGASGVLCWGSDAFGQLGDGAASGTGATAPIGLPAGIELVLAAEAHSCASSGINVWCWGDDTYSRLGIGDGMSHDEPAPLTPFTVPVVSLAGAFSHSCVVLMDEVAYCWGSNFFGELGIGSTSAGEPTPAQVRF